MSPRDEKFCAWMALPAMIFFFCAMLPAFHFLPPLSPELGAEEIAALYLANALGIKIGAGLMMFGGACLMPFVAAMVAATSRMGGTHRALAATQLACGVLTFVPLFLCGIFFAVAVFRPDRAPEDILLLSDLGWLFLVMPTPGFLVGLVAFGLAILGDTSPCRVFPRWVGYFNLWVGVIAVGGVMIPLFKTGPFAWDGLFAYWLPLAAFGIWMPVMLWAFSTMGPGTAGHPSDGSVASATGAPSCARGEARRLRSRGPLLL